MQKPPEKIYLVPSGDGWNWAEDPAQGAGMEVSDSIAYLAVNGSERALVSAAPSDDHATLVKQFRALSNLANALQARATHAERKLAACDHNAIALMERCLESEREANMILTLNLQAAETALLAHQDNELPAIKAPIVHAETGRTKSAWPKFNYEDFTPGLYWLRTESPEFDGDLSSDGQVHGIATGGTVVERVLAYVEKDSEGRPEFHSLEDDIPDDACVTHGIRVNIPDLEDH